MRMEKNKITIRAYAKVNLGIDMVRRMENGYHEVDMIMHSIGLYDVLTAEKTDEAGIALTCSDPTLACDSRNLVYRAAALLLGEDPQPGVRLHLEKNVPMQAGMGGGSSDAAACLKAVNELFGLGISDEDLQTRSVVLGADVPFCVKGGCCHAGGIGEVLTPLKSAPKCALVVVKPDAGVSTAQVYKNLKLETRGSYPHGAIVNISGIRKALEFSDLDLLAASMGNILELPSFPICPEIAECKELLLEQGAVSALMSGSGSAVFGIFRTEEEAEAAAEKLPERIHPMVTGFVSSENI